MSREFFRVLREHDSPTVANAVETFQMRDRCEGYLGGEVRCMFPELGTALGTVLTVTMDSRPGPVASRDGYWRMWHALERMEGPVIIAIADSSGIPSRVAYFGEIMATIATHFGAVGLVTDAGVRDLAEVKELGFHYFARYAVVSHGNFEVTNVGEPVLIAGQTLRTGDFVHGDANGVVIIPRDILKALPEAIERIKRRESEILAYLHDSDATLEGLQSVGGY